MAVTDVTTSDVEDWREHKPQTSTMFSPHAEPPVDVTCQDRNVISSTGGSLCFATLDDPNLGVRKFRDVKTRFTSVRPSDHALSYLSLSCHCRVSVVCAAVSVV
mmetsp:Transcript_51971/g.112956  ORF Transcript_51971/g.112956 Transcript_51971/m.112956 type:complete len:104 (+) Transcript_51971:1624-1935(+)